ncbi:MAG TPA: CNNM domain-containing protein [Burkholderiales bacterium]
METLILVCLILLNGLFAMSEVALLTARGPRLETLARQGDTLAAAAAAVAQQPTRFLSTVQIGITSIGLLSGIFGEAAFAEPLAVWLQSVGMEPGASSIVATAAVVIVVTYFSIVAGELVPKRLGQHNAESVARLVAWPMRLLALAAAPFVHLLSASTDAILNPLLKLLGSRPQAAGRQPLSPEDIRALVLEAGEFMPKKHQSILLNLFDLESTSVDDVMVPRGQIEVIDLEGEDELIRNQIATSYHTRLPVCQGSLDNVVGVLHVRAVLSRMRDELITGQTVREIMRDPYYIPSGTPLLTQLQNFQENQARFGLVVDEYGEIKGLVTLEDIAGEIIGEFTTRSPLQPAGYSRQADGSWLVEGSTPLRELNRKLGLALPVDGPRTLNGLILEYFQDSPEAGTSLKIADHPLEVVQTQDRVVKVVRVYPRLRQRA